MGRPCWSQERTGSIHQSVSIVSTSKGRRRVPLAVVLPKAQLQQLLIESSALQMVPCTGAATLQARRLPTELCWLTGREAVDPARRQVLIE